jgi:hypothetical protein
MNSKENENLPIDVERNIRNPPKRKLHAPVDKISRVEEDVDGDWWNPRSVPDASKKR